MVFKVKEAIEINKKELEASFSSYKDMCLYNQSLMIDTIGDELHGMLVDNCIVENIALFDDFGRSEGIGTYDFSLGEFVIAYGSIDYISYVSKISTEQQLLSIVHSLKNLLKIRGLSNK